MAFLKRLSEVFWGHDPARELRHPHETLSHASPSFTTAKPTWTTAKPTYPLTGAKRKPSIESEDNGKKKRFKGDFEGLTLRTAKKTSTGLDRTRDVLEGETLIPKAEYSSEESEDERMIDSPMEWVSEDGEDETALFSEDGRVSGLEDERDETALSPEDEEASNSEDVIVFDDVDGYDSLSDSDDNLKIEGDATIFEPSMFDDAEQDGSLVTDFRARVGSYDADFVPRRLLIDRGWPEDSVSLVQRLHQRGHEPLFPTHWNMDFRYLPEGLFLPAGHPNLAFINSVNNKDFRATRALSRLIALGPKARDKVTVGKSPERIICQELREYMAWADHDSSNQFPDYPLIQIYWGDAQSDVQEMQDRLLHGLSQLYQRWNDARSPDFGTDTPEAMEDSETLPTLYGVMISHTLVGIVTFVPGYGDSTGYLRSVGLFDFGVSDYDVWNSLALALLVVHARNVAVERGCSVPRPWMMKKRQTRRSLSYDPDA